MGFLAMPCTLPQASFSRRNSATALGQRAQGRLVVDVFTQAACRSFHMSQLSLSPSALVTWSWHVLALGPILIRCDDYCHLREIPRAKLHTSRFSFGAFVVVALK